VAKLSPEQIQEKLPTLTGWDVEGNTLRKDFEFSDFASAMIFVNRMAEAAEEANHHPDIDIRYSKVIVRLTSHDSGGITARDVKMAGTINQIVAD
jgi:4a-hydroxytetrahydrobiopterin dehydratase